jgi:signal peptidase I
MLTRIAILIAGTVFVLWAVAFVLLHTVFHLYRIPTGGMEPAIHIGDHVITKRIQDIRRGDIITFDYPLQPKTTFMKRVIGMPGETIRIQSKRVFINGKELSEPYAMHVDEQVYPENPALPEPYRSRDHFGPHEIAANTYFTMGDNRDRSSDSRYWGTVPRSMVRGEVVYAFGASGFRKIHGRQ